MVAFVESGEGPLLVCLHGIGGSSAGFDGLRHELDEQMRIVAWDAPGYAASPDPTSPPGLAGYVREALGLLDVLGGDPPVLLGMSWGGVIAASLAAGHPERVRGLVLGDSTRGSGQSPEHAAAMRSRAAELAAVGPEVFALRRAARLLARSASPDEVARVAQEMAASIRMPGYGFAAESMAQTDLSASLVSVQVPTLVLYGQDDRVTGEVESAALAASIAGAELHSIPGAGHLANQEQPRLFAQRLRDFISRLDG